jgi:type II secretory pathway pseudopilin PulG
MKRTFTLLDLMIAIVMIGMISGVVIAKFF